MRTREGMAFHCSPLALCSYCYAMRTREGMATAHARGRKYPGVGLKKKWSDPNIVLWFRQKEDKI